MAFLVLAGRVKTGKKLGKKLGFPTINIAVSKAVKKNQWGIYFSLIKIAGKFYAGVTHLGPPKTFSLSRATCETHLLSFRGDLYGKPVEKRLLFKFREVERFPNVAKLKKQIRRDVRAAKKFFGI